MAATKIITNAWKVRTLPDIFYEEPEPVEDGMQQEPPIAGSVISSANAIV